MKTKIKKSSKTYFVYILRTSENTLYTGQTNNLQRRLEEHKKGGVKSAKYLRNFSFDLVHQEIYNSRAEAMKREREVKSWPKAKKEELIRSDSNKSK